MDMNPYQIYIRQKSRLEGGVWIYTSLQILLMYEHVLGIESIDE